MKNAIRILAVLLLCVSALARAADLMRVEGLQMPAWVERDGKREPLLPGMALRNGDTVMTGDGARALLRLADGSTVKLGENGRLSLAGMDKRPGSATTELVTASLDVLAGAFRFTTTTLFKFRGERDVKVKIVTMTAGIRGTDVWGKAASDRDIVCLIRGTIEVTRGPDNFTMAEPMSFFIAPRNAAPAPVARVSEQQLAEWAKETDIPKGSGVRKGGAFGVLAVTHTDEKLARQAQAELGSLGFASSLRTVKTETGATYYVRIAQLASKQEADAIAAKLKAAGFIEAKVAR